MIIKEEITNYFWPATRYTSPTNISNIQVPPAEAREYRYYSYRANYINFNERRDLKS